jgi:uncharacterized membrane protein YhhN
MSYVLLTAYVVMSVMHLYYSWVEDKKGRAWTKPFLLVLLLGYYVLSCDKPSIVLLLALLTSWLGDVLLILHGHGWFAAGGISFMFSHFLFIVVYTENIGFENAPWLIVVPLALLYYGVSAKIISMLWPYAPKKMRAVMYVYLLANSTMNVFAFLQLLTSRRLGALVAYLGALLFFISDCCLFLVRYYKKKPVVFKGHFTVMLTYLAGEFLIAQGMLMLAA